MAAPHAGYFGVEAYPDFSAKAAVLCSHLVWNHPLPDGNKRTAYLCLREFVARNGHTWHTARADDTVSMIEGLAAGRVSEQQLRSWIEDRIAA